MPGQTGGQRHDRPRSAQDERWICQWYTAGRLPGIEAPLVQVERTCQRPAGLPHRRPARAAVREQGPGSQRDSQLTLHLPRSAHYRQSRPADLPRRAGASTCPSPSAFSPRPASCHRRTCLTSMNSGRARPRRLPAGGARGDSPASAASRNGRQLDCAGRQRPLAALAPNSRVIPAGDLLSLCARTSMAAGG